MRLTLQEMVAGAIAEASDREKLAQAEPPAKEEKKPPEASAKKCPECEKAEGECKCPKKESAGYKCASVDSGTVEKVATALDFINTNMGHIDWEKVAVGVPLAPQPDNAPEPQVGPAKGATSIETNMDNPTAGMQSTNTGEAGSGKPEMKPGPDTASRSEGQTNAATATQTDLGTVPGGTGEQPQLEEKTPLKNEKVASVRSLWSKIKQAADAENPAKISAGKEPLENPDGTAAEEKVPSQPAAMSKQEGMVGSNEAAINYTKGQAKAEPKRQMGEVLTEPAQKKSTDPVLHENLDATSGAGVKLSSVQAKAARAYLRKMAQAGESDDATPEEKEKAKKLKDAVEAKKKGGEKEKQSQGVGPAPTALPQAPTTPMGTPPA